MKFTVVEFFQILLKLIVDIVEFIIFQSVFFQ